MRYILAALAPVARVACATARSTPAFGAAFAAPPDRIAGMRTALPAVAGIESYEV